MTEPQRERSGSVTRVASFSRGESGSVQRSGSFSRGEVKKDSSKSTADGEWEMRDGKWYRKDYFALEKQEPKEVIKIACQMCPTHIQKITMLTQERDKLIGFLNERDRLIVELRARLENWEKESIEWLNDRRIMETHIAELEAMIAERRDWFSPAFVKEKELIIVNLNARIAALLAEKEDMAARMLKMQQIIDNLEKQNSICKTRGYLCNCKDKPAAPAAPAPSPVTFVQYVPVTVPAPLPHIEVTHVAPPLIKPGKIVVEAVEGATVANPEYISQAETVPGQARLRVRMVDFVSMGAQNFVGSELFGRLRLGDATLFTQPRAFQFSGVAWHQDMVFIDVPLRPHQSGIASSCSVFPLVVEVVARTIGTMQEIVIGSATVDISDLVHNTTRANTVPLSSGGAVNLRIKALDFGLMSVGGGLLQQQWTSIHRPPQCIMSAPTMSSVVGTHCHQYIQPSVIRSEYPMLTEFPTIISHPF